MINPLKNLFKDSMIYGTAELLNRSLQIFLLPLIFIYLKPEQFGVLDYFLMIKNLFSVFLGIGLGTVILRAPVYKDQYTLSQIVTACFLIILISDLVFISLMTLWSEQITSVLLNDVFKEELILSCATSCFFALRAVPLGALRVERQAPRFLIVSVANFAFYLLISFYLVKYQSLGYMAFLYGGLFSIMISTSIGVYFVRHHMVFEVPAKIIKDLLSFGLSILASSTCMLLIGSLNRVFLKFNASFEDLAIFGMANRLSIVVGALLVAPFSLAWLPFVSAKYKEKTDFKEVINAVYLIYSFIGVFLILSISIFSQEALLLFGETDYLASSKYIPLFAIAFLFQGYYFIFSAGIFLKGDKKAYYKISAITLLGTLGMYMVASPILDIMLASIITMLSFVLLFLCAWYYGKQIMQISLFPKEVIILSVYTALTLSVSLSHPIDEISGSTLIIKVGLMLFFVALSYFHLKRKLFSKSS